MTAAKMHRAVSHVLERLEQRVLFAIGDLDPSFAGGSVIRDFFGHNDFGMSIAVQSDNKVLVAGWIASGTSTGNDIAVLRLNENGTLDTTFGAGTGFVVTDLGSTSDAAYAIAVQSDGRIVVAGQTQGATTQMDFALVRYNSDGSLDSGFGVAGKVVTDFNHDYDQASAMTLMSGGRIVVAGWTTVDGYSQFAAARYLSDGSLDSGFGVGGLVSAVFANGYSQAKSVATMPDGSLVLAGTLTDFNSFGSDFAAVHLLANGSLDASFGTNGWAQLELGGEYEIAYAIAVQSNGRIVLAGESLDYDSGADDFAIVRLTSTGVLDSTFGTGGVVFTDFAGEYEQASSVVVQTDGKIVAGGVASVAGRSRFAIAPYNADGSLDSGFKGGKVTLALNTEASAGGMAMDSQGRIVLAGFTYNNSGNYDFATARFVGKINLVPSAITTGPYTATVGGSAEFSGASSFDPDGVIVSYAWDFDYDGSSFDVDASGATTSFSATSAGVRTIALRVMDDNGAMIITTTTVTINPAPPDPDPDPEPEPEPQPLPTPAPGTVVLVDDPENAGKQILVLAGTSASDRVQFKSVKGGKVEVRLNGRKLGTFGNVSRIVARGRAGNDRMDASGVKIPVAFFGEAGNDRLVGSRFSDILVGGDGNDHLFGNRGNDLIVGGAGQDDLHSRFGNDILVGGSLTFQDDLAKLTEVLSAWTQSARLTLLSDSTVVDDSVRDILYGNPSLDWMITGAGDKVKKLNR